MAKGYRRVDRDQQFLLPPDMREWLPASDPVWLVIELIEGLDTSRFHEGRRIGGAGRAGYDPDMLLTLLVWAWLQEVHSSRRIERLCGRDVSFRVICAGDVPDHATIARFRQGFGEAAEQLFAEVVVLARRLGLVQLGVVALDGTKIAAPASSGQNRTADGLRQAAKAEQQRQAEAEQQRQEREWAQAAAREAAARHAAQDAEEDARFGPGHGDVMPDDPGRDPVGDPGRDPADDSSAGPGGGPAGGPGRARGGSAGGSRSARIAEALADLDQEARQREAEQQAKSQARQARQAERGDRPVDGRPPAGSEVGLAQQALAAARAELAERYQRWQATGRGRNPCPNGVLDSAAVRKALARVDHAQRVVAARESKLAGQKPSKGPVRNITDPQSRLQPLAGGGWLQGYNAQAVTSSDGIIVATEVSNSSSDVTAFQPMMQAAVAMAQRLGAEPIGLILADAGYLSIDNLTIRGPDRLIAVGNRRSVEAAARDPAPADDAGNGSEAIAAMRARLATPDGIAAYRQRGRIAETTFGHGKHNLGFRRFTGIGLDRAKAEWTFHAAVHNLSKIINHGGLRPGWQTG
jgi:transposase